MPAGELRDRADAGSIAAMEELARRLVQGIGMPKDPQAGAGWLLRAAQSGSAQAAFNVAVMYERGFMLERNFAKAIEWYRRAVEADLAIAKHNLALMLRDGKGVARDGREAIELLQSAARQGMAASMFSLGDIYERGDAAPKDVPMAMAWFAITAEFERQANRGAETALAKTSATRALALQRGLMQEDLQKAEQIGQVSSAPYPSPASRSRCSDTSTGAAPHGRPSSITARRPRSTGLAQREQGSGPNSPEGALRSQASARQARWRIGAHDTCRHPNLPTHQRPARDWRTHQGTVCIAEGSGRASRQCAASQTGDQTRTAGCGRVGQAAGSRDDKGRTAQTNHDRGLRPASSTAEFG
jgi:hypothetical protein